MINKVIRSCIAITGIIILCFAFYEIGQEVGRNEAKIKVVEKKVEVIRYVEKKKAVIHSKPNIGRDRALQLFNDGIL